MVLRIQVQGLWSLHHYLEATTHLGVCTVEVVVAAVRGLFGTLVDFKEFLGFVDVYANIFAFCVALW